MSIKSRTYQFLRWLRDVLDMLCDRPNHLQRLSAVGAGMAVGLIVIGLISVITFFGLATTTLPLAPLVIPILGNALYGFIFVFAICVLVIIALVKGLGTFKMQLPGGAGFGFDTTEKVPEPTRDRDDGWGGGGYGGGGWGRHDNDWSRSSAPPGET